MLKACPWPLHHCDPHYLELYNNVNGFSVRTSCGTMIALTVDPKIHELWLKTLNWLLLLVVSYEQIFLTLHWSVIAKCLVGKITSCCFVLFLLQICDVRRVFSCQNDLSSFLWILDRIFKLNNHDVPFSSDTVHLI
jgi:hypothetical protein